MVLNIYTDGGARGNPGIAGYGWVIKDDLGQVIAKDSKFLGIKTNNQAEYSGLIGALTWIKENSSNMNIAKLNFYSDSQLMVRQIMGLYRVKSPELLGLYQSVSSLLAQINIPSTFTDIRRSLNSFADELANQAMDRQS